MALRPRCPHCDPFRIRRHMAHILIIEDYPDTRDVAQFVLLDAGHTVSSATDGASGLFLAARDQPDLILMDLGLPRLDGWAATQRLKAYPLTWHIPVVAFTAYVTQDDIARASAVGCVAVITKPFEIDTLLTTVATVLASSAPSWRVRAVARDCE